MKLPAVTTSVREIDGRLGALSDASQELARSEDELRAAEERPHRSERHLLDAQRAAAMASFEVEFTTKRITDQTWRIPGLDPNVGLVIPALIEALGLPEGREIFRKSFADTAAGKRGTRPSDGALQPWVPAFAGTAAIKVMPISSEGELR